MNDVFVQLPNVAPPEKLMTRDAAAEFLDLPYPVNKRKILRGLSPSVHRPAFKKNVLKQRDSALPITVEIMLTTTRSSSLSNVAIHSTTAGAR